MMEWIHGMKPGAVPDSMVFRLHYRTTVFIFLTFGLVLGFLQVFGDPITCMKINGYTDKSFVENYCWNELLNNVSVINNSPSKSFAYIKTLPLLFIFQSFLFYLTHYLWKVTEGGLLNGLSLDLIKRSNAVKAIYFEKSFGKLGMSALLFFFMEILNVLNAFSNFVYIDRLMNHQFWNYGWNVSQHLVAISGYVSDPRQSVFPRAFQCWFKKVGPSGVVERQDISCILGWSFLLETLVLFVWGWLIVLLAISVLSVLYRLITFCSSSLRFRILRGSAVGLLLSDDQLGRFISTHSIGSWFTLMALSEHVPPSNLVDNISDNAGSEQDSILESIVSAGKQ